jgi:hypothetical protein
MTSLIIASVLVSALQQSSSGGTLYFLAVYRPRRPVKGIVLLLVLDILSEIKGI